MGFDEFLPIGVILWFLMDFYLLGVLLGFLWVSGSCERGFVVLIDFLFVLVGDFGFAFRFLFAWGWYNTRHRGLRCFLVIEVFFGWFYVRFVYLGVFGILGLFILV